MTLKQLVKVFERNANDYYWLSQQCLESGEEKNYYIYKGMSCANRNNALLVESIIANSTKTAMKKRLKLLLKDSENN